MPNQTAHASGSPAPVDAYVANIPTPRPFDRTYPGQEIASSPTNPFPSRPHEVWMGESHTTPSPNSTPQSTDPETHHEPLDWSRISLYAAGETPRPTPCWQGIQAKLTVGQPNDQYEQEADRVAEQVMRLAPPTTPNIQRQAEEEQEEVQTKPLVETITPIVQRQEASEDQPIRAKCESCEVVDQVQRSPAGVPQVQADLEDRLSVTKGGGSPLPDDVRSFMEPRFKADFSQVRVHTGSSAVQMNRDLNAQAFTHKQDVYFGAGKAPGKDALTAHELTHVVQQRGQVRPKFSSSQLKVHQQDIYTGTPKSRILSENRQYMIQAQAAPPAPSPLPTTMPVPGATDFQINRVATSSTSRIFFARGDSALSVDALSAVAAIKATTPASVRLIGYASADEPAALAQTRANNVRSALSVPPAVNVVSAVGNAAATATRSDFTQVRSVEVLIGAAPSSTLDCTARDSAGNLTNPPKQPCATMDPPTATAFGAAMPLAVDAMNRAVAAVTGVPSAANAVVIDRFFGNHSAATLTTLRTNLNNLRSHVIGLPPITQCGAQCDVGGCAEGPIAYNTDVDAASTMTLCVPTFKGLPINDQVRNLIHESAHGTSPLGGTAATGTRDVAYRHERMIFHLSPSERLRNSDSYALFALFLREIQMTGNPSAVPAGVSTPASDTLTGFTSSQESALRLALAQLEKRLTWSKDWTGQLYGEVVKVKAGTTSWSTSWAESLMQQAARRFPLTAPPTTPSLTDQTRIASITERYSRMKLAVKRDLTATRMSAGVVIWPGAGGTWLASNSLQVGPAFFRATPANQVSLLLEQLATATQDVEPAFVPAYVSLAKWIHNQNP